MRPTNPRRLPSVRLEFEPGLWIDSRLALWIEAHRWLVVADEDYLSFGVTSEVLAVIAERDPSVLKAPAVRVAYPDVPVPFSRPMEEFCLPNVERIVAAVRTTMTRGNR